MKRARLTLAFLALAALPLGCAGDEFSPEAAVADAAVKTTEAKTSRVMFHVEVDSPERSFAFGGEGVFEYDGTKGRAVLDMSGVMEAAGTPTDDATLEMRMDFPVAYVRLPKSERVKLGVNEPWLKVDLEVVEEEAGFDLTGLVQSDMNPASRLQFMRAASDEIEELGEETVRGVATTHYRFSVDLDRVAQISAERADLPPEIAEQLEVEVARLKRETGIDAIPTDAWIDDEGLLRKMTMTFNFGPGADGGKLVSTMELYDFGVPVVVQPPPSSQVLDVSEAVLGPP